jgi:hypothetical protein
MEQRLTKQPIVEYFRRNFNASHIPCGLGLLFIASSVGWQIVSDARQSGQVLEASTKPSGLDSFGGMSGVSLKSRGQPKEHGELDDKACCRVQYLCEDNQQPMFPEVRFLAKLGLRELDFDNPLKQRKASVGKVHSSTEFEDLVVQKTARSEYQRIGLLRWMKRRLIPRLNCT